MIPFGLVLGGAALAAVPACSLGMLLERARWRRAFQAHRDLYEAELARVEAELATLQERLPERFQRAYDAGQGAMLEQLTGLHAAEPWAPVPPPRWAALMEAREQPGVN